MPSLTHSAPEGGPVFDVPDVRTYGVVYKMSMQADSRGAVLLAYTKDPETGQITRTQLRIDLAGVAYMRGRLDRITAADERCQSARA
ncbi:hypothetical protein, partial [Streptomyces sp. NPDC088731]|uniref:hypothetical protein n=1 Tax=Streptomyces sp. NPDC088731 TaxID=3365878 RepID=UPI003818A70A